MWFKAPKEFIKSNVKSASSLGKQEVYGVPTQLVEWAVSEADRYKAFGRINVLLAKGGKLRVNVAPQLGFALPRVEHVGVGDKVQALFEAKGFEEKGPGIFIPKECTLQDFDQDGPGSFIRYRIKSFRKVNEPLADSDFWVTIPEGTTVADMRSPEGTNIFRVGEGPPPDLEGLVQFGGEKAGAAWPRWVALAIGVAIGGILLAWYFLKKRKRASTS